MTTCSAAPVDLDARWRPDDSRGPACGYTLRDKTCLKSGAHYCEPRADKVVLFFLVFLVHIKGRMVRRAFRLEWWQEWEIIRPLFGEVVWSDEFGEGRYVRRYRIAYLVMARKNGKSELAAGIQLYMLVGDDEEAAEVLCAAADKDQAGKVFEPSVRMVQLSPQLARRIKHFSSAGGRLVDEKTSSVYRPITADAAGELGANPHSFNLDEVLSQPDGTLWDAMTTADGTRDQELFFATTTETSDGTSFGAGLIDEAEKVQEDPTRAPHIFAFVRKLPLTDEQLEALQKVFPDHPDLPVSTDPYDEANWRWPNPALDQFKSRESLRRHATNARNDPDRENAFFQFQLNRRVGQVHRWMPMHLYDASSADLWLTPDYHRDQLVGRQAWGGLDLAATSDLTAWCLLVPGICRVAGAVVDGYHALWRFWLPEAAVKELDKRTEGKYSKWARQGWITVTEGNVVDYDRVYDDIAQDGRDFRLQATDADQWSSAPVIQAVEKRLGVWEIDAYQNTYQRMSPGMHWLMNTVKARRLFHHGNPVARACFDAVEVRKSTMDPNLIRPEKPERSKVGKRIDAVPTAAMAGNAVLRTTVVHEDEPDEPEKIVVSAR